MRWFRKTDPIDVVLSDELADGDFTDVAALVHEMRSAYVPTERPAPSEELAAFAALDEGQHPLRANRPLVAQRQVPVAVTTPRPERIPHMRKTVTAFAATLTGKIVLGTAVAAAAVGGAAATNIPIELPSQTEDPQIVQAERPELPEQADDANTEEGPETEDNSEDHAFGEGRPEEANVPEFVDGYLEQVAAWVDCVRTETAEQAQNNDPDFDLQEACSEHELSGPENPGEGEPSATAGDNANDNATEGADNAEQGAENGNAGETPAPSEQGEPQGGPDTADEHKPAGAGAAAEDRP